MNISELWQDFSGAAPFLRNALWVSLLASIALGIGGTFVVINRISYLAGAIAHCALGGIGFALYAQNAWGWQWFAPWCGALLAAVLSALLLSWIVRNARERADTAISALWCFGMAVGLIFIAITPGYHDPMSYLFGNILMITSTHLWLTGMLSGILLLLLWIFHRPLYALSLDNEFAGLRGIPTPLYHSLLLTIIAVTVVLLVQTVGIILVIALITLPAALAGRFTHRLLPMIALAAAFSASLQSVGLLFSYALDMPSGATIVLLTSMVYVTVATLKKQ